MVNVQGSLSTHLVGDVGIGIQRGLCGDVANDGGQGFDIHPVLQEHGGEGVPEVVEAYLAASCPFQNHLQPLADIAGINGLLRFGAGGKHQVREHTLFVLCQQLHHGGRQDDSAVAALVLGSLMTSLLPTG